MPHTKDIILFDLDGTLTDSGPGITNSIAYALKEFGIDEKPEALVHFIGEPLAQTLQSSYGFSETEVADVIAAYRVRYGTKGMFENIVYEGIPVLLQRLHAANKMIVLATSKPTFYAEQILAHFDLLPYFTFVAGSNMDNTRTDKAEVIAYAIENITGFTKENAIMVGDRHYDIIGAMAHGLDTIGVCYGYGSEKELKDVGASHIAKNVDGLSQLLCMI